MLPRGLLSALAPEVRNPPPITGHRGQDASGAGGSTGLSLGQGDEALQVWNVSQTEELAGQH